MLQRSFVLALASDGVVNERFENSQLVSAVQHSLQENWNTRVSKTNPASASVGPHFLGAMSSEDWTEVAASVLSTTKHSNGGDNQSIHLAQFTQHFDDQSVLPQIPECSSGENAIQEIYLCLPDLAPATTMLGELLSLGCSDLNAVVPCLWGRSSSSNPHTASTKTSQHSPRRSMSTP